ncbi:MAG: hypothetical protein KBG38_00025 [Candidatus Cloacimonas sp.]|nr:hypothetical protein [Candidatus Cloacimonas sp.]
MGSSTFRHSCAGLNPVVRIYRPLGTSIRNPNNTINPVHPCPQPSALSPKPLAKIILFIPFLLSFLFAISEIGIDLA